MQPKKIAEIKARVEIKLVMRSPHNEEGYTAVGPFIFDNDPEGLKKFKQWAHQSPIVQHIEYDETIFEYDEDGNLIGQETVESVDSIFIHVEKRYVCEMMRSEMHVNE